MNYIKNKSIIIFDGICNLCNSSVRFIIKNDPKEHFVFASLQSDAAKEILLQLADEKFSDDSIVLIENGKIHVGSTAALKILRRLNHPVKLFYCFIVLPKKIRDYVYQYIAKNRYKWFGKRKKCMIPTAEIKGRFIESL